jgi:sec-independent protein translocase protein TatA
MRPITLAVLIAFFASGSAFLVSKSPIQTKLINGNSIVQTKPIHHTVPASLQKERKSVAHVQTMGLFGLGLPEIGIIVFAAILVLGPQKLAEMTRDAGKMTAGLSDELKEIPKEFKKGLEEGEIESRARNAKPMKKDIEEE